MSQLGLKLELADPAVFASFLEGPNQAACRHLRALVTGRSSGAVWLWGPTAVGKTHLLQASSVASDEQGCRSVFLPLREPGLAPDLLVGLGSWDLVCLDDVDRVAGDTHWERALFGVVEELMSRGGQLVIATRSPPRSVGLGLADLASRLRAATVFRLQSLDDQQLHAALVLRAGLRGLELPSATGDYLLRRFPRDMRALFGLLDRLDSAAIAAQRRLTIPFVRQVLNPDDAPAA